MRNQGRWPVGYIGRAVRISEQELIARIRRLARAGRRKSVVTGIGDDSAVLRLARGRELLVTTDFTLEDAHFRRAWHPALSVGHRALTRGLSDIAAMGGQPLAAFLSLALPADLPQAWAEGFLRGFLRLAREFATPLAGGDVAQSPRGVAADIVVVGSVEAGRALLRSGARPGDSLYVTGQLGRAAALLFDLREGRKVSPRAPENRPHFFPVPRLAVGRALASRRLATAAIDVSDGLSTDLAHICAESGTGALVIESAIPRPVRREGGSLHFALHGGDDYELLFTARPSAVVPPSIAGIRITRIGEIIRDPRCRIFLVDSHGQRKHLIPAGWQHFGR